MVNNALTKPLHCTVKHFTQRIVKLPRVENPLELFVMQIQ
ncbi:hypothetical protein D047_4661 [Vibrio parahaemolyticus VPTS-2010_2]|nr:hypothetical protein D047_4661 [Vibrio parahaemolyticus VPTS-2010_2]